MPPFPVNMEATFGPLGAFFIYFVIGYGFGTVLELAGFGQSTKLAGQFYFKDMTVLKVMFTGIITAMVLVFLASGLGILDYNLIFVNPTYVWPGIIGGLIMGVGFIVGGFCPGTSLVAAATLKLDGIMFVLGVFFGIFVFGETVGFFEDFFNSSYLGRFTLMDLFNAEVGIIVVVIVAAALIAFFASERLEQRFGGKPVGSAPRWRYGAAAGMMAAAVLVLIVGQPTNADRWAALEAEKQPLLDGRAVQVHPLEVLNLKVDPGVKLIMLDVRDEADYNLFHVIDSRHIPLESLLDEVPELLQEPSNTVFVTVSNDEAAATEAWKMLVADALPNVYILEGGINNWIDFYAEEDFKQAHAADTLIADAQDDRLNYRFAAALGSRYDAAEPHVDHFAGVEYESKVKLEASRASAGGGCG